MANNTNSNHRFKIRAPYLLFLISFLVLISHSIFGQLVFEDTKGEEVLVQYIGGLFSVNSANESIRIGYAFRDGEVWCFGVDAVGKAENGVASLFGNGDFTPGVKINFNIGYVFNSEWRKKNKKVYADINKKREKEKEKIEAKYKAELDKWNKNKENCPDEILKIEELLEEKKQKELEDLYRSLEKEAINRLVRTIPKQTRWINLRVGYEKAKFKIFSPEASFEEQIKEEEFDGFSVQLSYQSYLFHYNALVNLSLGFKRTNNISELKKVELTDETIYGNSGQTTRLNDKKFTAWQGTFEKFNMRYILLSNFWKPSEASLGVLTYGRYSYSSLIRSLNLGIGGFILKAKDDKTGFVPLGGIMVEYEDKFKSEMAEVEDISFGDRFTISLVLNIPFLPKTK